MTSDNQERGEEKALRFDPSKPNCFARFINRDDAEVTALLAGLRDDLDADGEYDQGMTAYMPWDDARDLLTIAEMLWSQRLVSVESSEVSE